jgi:hypothetical protein
MKLLMIIAGIALMTGSAHAEKAELKVNCLIHEKGKDRLTEKDFVLQDYVTRTLFEADGVKYFALFTSDGDFRSKEISALSLSAFDTATGLTSYARGTWKASDGFKQVRLDVERNGAAKIFFLCDAHPFNWPF